MTSFVLRVMSEAVENLSISADENDSTLRNTCARRSRPMAADIRAPTKLQSTAAAIMPSVSRSIFPPVRSR